MISKNNIYFHKLLTVLHRSSHTLAILQAASRLTLSILISKLRVWLEAAINLVTCFLDLYVVFIIFILISAGEPLETVLFFAAGEPLKTLFFIFPPVVFLVAESLGDAIHCFAKWNGHLFVFATILVLPRSDYQQLISSTTLYTFH